MKLTVKTLKPRNPFVAASRRRVAGAHRAGKARQRARIETLREVERLGSSA